jgi:hypothetical protein
LPTFKFRVGGIGCGSWECLINIFYSKLEEKWWFIRKKNQFQKLFLIQCFEAARTIVQIKTVGDAKSQIKIYFAKLLSPMNWNENNLPLNCFSLSFFWFQSSWIILSDVKCINGIGFLVHVHLLRIIYWSFSHFISTTTSFHTKSTVSFSILQIIALFFKVE